MAIETAKLFTLTPNEIYECGKRDGIKQGLLRAAEILVKRMGMNEDDAEVEAIRAEAEK